MFNTRHLDDFISFNKDSLDGMEHSENETLFGLLMG